MNFALLGNHPAIKKIRELIKLVSDTSFSVLITGDTGTGKEVVARLLHEVSARKSKRFIKVNCAALPLTLLESELFGYEKGAFTGADKQKLGKFELACDGVIFLDEIGDMSLPLQSKLLEVLQSGCFTRLGGTRDVKVDSWVISSTNHSLEEDIKQARFREDLFYRLNIIRIEIPPLRERREDVPLLIRYFMERHKGDVETTRDIVIPRDLMRLFDIYHWPGNVRELSSTVLRLMIGDEPDVIASEIVANMKGDGLSPVEQLRECGFQQADTQNADSGAPADSQSHLELKAEATRYIEREAILYALAKADGNKRAAARMLQVSFKTLYTKMENLGISKEVASRR